MSGVGPKAAYVITKKYLNNMTGLLTYLKSNNIKNSQLDLSIKFIKAYLAFKMGVIVIPFLDTILHKNVIKNS